MTDVQLQEVAARVVDMIRAESKSVGEVAVHPSLDGVTTLPAIKRIGSVAEVVSVPLYLFGKPSDEATQQARAAAEKAETAADSVTEGVLNITDLKAKTEEATDKANTAAANLEGLKTGAETATTNANKASAGANEMIKSGNAVIADCRKASAEATEGGALARAAAGLAEEEIRRMQEVEQSISGAASLAPVQMELTYLKVITQRNPVKQKILALLKPLYALQNVLFLGDEKAVSVTPDGSLTVNEPGISRIHVIPTGNTNIYQTIEIQVVPPAMRLTKDGAIRLNSDGSIRLT